MKNRLLICLTVLGLVGFSLPVNAGTIAGITGTDVRAGTQTDSFYKLGTGFTGTLNSVYVTIGDNSQVGYVTNVQLVECTNSSYSSGCNGGTYGTTGLYVSEKTVGAASLKGVALSGANTKRTIRLDFSIHSAPNCNPGVSCTGVTTAITLDATKFYGVYFGANSLENASGTAKQIYVYGIAVELSDASGNPEYCGTAWTTSTRCSAGVLGTPYFLFTDTALTDSELSTYGGIASTGFPTWPIPTGFPLSNGASYGLMSSSSLTGRDLGYFGNMLIDAALFLFSPWDQATADAWTNFRNSITVHVPFSYVTETYTMVQAATVASGSIPSWTFHAPIVGSVSFFSASTITSYAPSGFLTLLRALAAAAIWFAFLWHVYHTVRHLWK